MPLSDLTADALNAHEPQRACDAMLHFVAQSAVPNDALLVLSLDTFSAPKFSHNVIELDHLNEKRKFAGKRQHDDLPIVYKDLVTSSIAQALYNWFQLVQNDTSGKIGFAAGASGYKRNGYVITYAPDGTLDRQWNYHGIFPSQFDGGDFDFTSDDYVRVNVTFTYDKCKISSSPGTPPAAYS